MAFEFEPVSVRDYDERGKVLCAGLLWTEWRMMVLAFTVHIGILSLMAAVTFHFTASHAFSSVTVPTLVWVAIGCAFMAFKRARLTRSIMFFRDGSIETPQGLPFKQAAHYMPRHHAQIRSIERAGRGNYWFVDIYTSIGAIVPVARLNRMSEAHMVVTQLNNALEELRRDMLLAEQRPREDALID